MTFVNTFTVDSVNIDIELKSPTLFYHLPLFGQTSRSSPKITFGSCLVNCRIFRPSQDVKQFAFRLVNCKL